MKWSDINTNPGERILRQFGCLCFVSLMALGVFEYRKEHHWPGVVMGIIGLVIGILGLIAPRALRGLYVGWIRLTFPVGVVINEIALAVMFFCVLTPVALLFRCAGRDLLKLKPSQRIPSYWVERPPARDLRRYFRQY
jgi:hypothetical protein